MKHQDDLYNSWINAHSENIYVTLTDFGIPNNAIVDDIQIMLRIKTSTSGWTWFVRFSDNYGLTYNNPDSSCRLFGGVCRYNTTTSFNSLTSPTLTLLNNNSFKTITGEMLNNASFIVNIHQNTGFKNTDIDLLKLNVRYHLSTTPARPDPTPFLVLPWNYSSAFEDMALNPNSWFDHEYPLQNIPCCTKKVRTFAGFEIDDYYRSHSGYDYGRTHGVELDTPVLAAASGVATFESEANSGGAGNVIKIDHGNGYQTWYEHLSIDELVVNSENESVEVVVGQQIGKVGMTGNTNGPHIHFSVFKDANENGTFDDDYPYGLVDPLGWDGSTSDPWTERSDDGRVGATSYNLFTQRIKPTPVPIPPSGGNLVAGGTNVAAPSGAFLSPVTMTLSFGPYVATAGLKSISPSISLAAKNSIGEIVSQLAKPVTITISYDQNDVVNIDEGTIKMYWLNDESGAWEEMPTTVDAAANVITSQTNHFSYFAAMGAVLDTVTPTTTVMFDGLEGQLGWFRSDVAVELIGEDNSGGVGLGYTIYSLNGTDWLKYSSPVVFNSEGIHTIKYMSIDNADNREDIKSVSFQIDKTSPEVSLDVNPTLLWPPNGKMVKVNVNGSASDENLLPIVIEVKDEYGIIEPLLSNFGEQIELEAARRGSDVDGRQYLISSTARDKAGNTSKSETTVTVPHSN